MSEKQNDVYMVESQDTPSDQNQQEQTEAQRARFLSLDSPTPGQEPGEIYADPNKGSTQDEHKNSKRGRSVLRRKHKKRKHRRHRTPSSSSGSSSGSSESSSQSSSPSPPRPRAKKHKSSTVERFEIISKKDRNQWELTDDLATYANNTKFIPDKYIFDNILEDSPVPRNILEAPKLDPFVISLLTDTRNTFEITRDKQMKRISQKLRDVYGPLSKVLHQMDVFKHSGKAEMTFDHDQFSEALEQSVRLIGQAQGAIIFQRQRTILGAITKSDNKAKNMIKEEYAEELETTEDNMLFGKHFQKKLEKRSKSNQKSIERFLSPQRQEYRHRQPFPTAPPTSTSFGGGPRVGRFVRGVDNRGNANRGKTFSSKITSVKQTNPKVIKGIKTSRTPLDIEIISQNMKPQSTFCRKAQIFCERVEENNFRSGNTEHSYRVENKYPYKRPHCKKNLQHK